jgi:hypothetical protein
MSSILSEYRMGVLTRTFCNRKMLGVQVVYKDGSLPCSWTTCPVDVSAAAWPLVPRLLLYCLTYGDSVTAIMAWRIVLPIFVDYLYTKHFSVAECPCQHPHTIFRKDAWHHINWFALYRVTWYDFQEVKWILVSLSDMQQKWDNSNENTWKFMLYQINLHILNCYWKYNLY